MKQVPPTHSDEAFVKGLDALCDEIPLDDREVEDTLREAGVSPEAATALMLDRIHELDAQQRAERFARAESERLAVLAKPRVRRAHRSRSDMLARLSQIRAQVPAAAAMFRDFKSSSDEDLDSLLQDLEELVSSGEE